MEDGGLDCKIIRFWAGCWSLSLSKWEGEWPEASRLGAAVTQSCVLSPPIHKEHSPNNQQRENNSSSVCLL